MDLPHVCIAKRSARLERVRRTVRRRPGLESNERNNYGRAPLIQIIGATIDDLGVRFHTCVQAVSTRDAGASFCRQLQALTFKTDKGKLVVRRGRKARGLLESWRRLSRRQPNGGHVFSFQLKSRPLLSAPGNARLAFAGSVRLALGCAL